MKNNESREIYLEFLKKEGYNCKIIENNLLEFEHEGKTYNVMFVVREDGSEFVHLIRCGTWQSNTKDEITKILYVLNDVNKETPGVKSYIDKNDNGENIIYVEACFLIKEPDDFFKIFSLFFHILQDASNYLKENLKKIESKDKF